MADGLICGSNLTYSEKFFVEIHRELVSKQIEKPQHMQIHPRIKPRSLDAKGFGKSGELTRGGEDGGGSGSIVVIRMRDRPE
jgi:hypothetical protein